MDLFFKYSYEHFLLLSIIIILFIIGVIFFKRKFVQIVIIPFFLSLVVLFGTNYFNYLDNIQKYQDEIDDFIGWESEEAKYRIVGNIKRLNRLGITKIILIRCYLKGADLTVKNLKRSWLSYANLEGADLMSSNLQRADLSSANLKYIHLDLADLQATSLFDANLQGADLFGANLKGARLFCANLKGANLYFAKLKGADLRKTNFKYSLLVRADLRGVKDLTKDQLLEAFSLYKTILDEKLKEEIMNEKPELFEPNYEVKECNEEHKGRRFSEYRDEKLKSGEWKYDEWESEKYFKRIRGLT